MSHGATIDRFQATEASQNLAGDQEPSTSFHNWWWLIPLLLVTFWLGARGLDADPIWFDEWWSIYHAGGAHYGPISPVDTWMRVAQEDPRNTPSYYLLLQAWGLITGWTPFAGRSLSLLIGLLAVAMVYRVGRDLISPAAGVGAAVVLGTGTFFTYYLHELRGYTLYVLLTAVCIWSYWRLLNRTLGWRTYLLLFLSIVGLLYTHYFASVTVAAIGLYHLLFASKNGRWRRLSLVIGLACLTFVPWLQVLSSIVGFFEDTGATTQFALEARPAAQSALFMFSNGSVGLLAFFAVAGLVRRQHSTKFIWFWGLSALGIALVVNELWSVILHVRYLMALWPALALIVALGVDYLYRKGIPLPIPLSIWVISGLWNTFDPISLSQVRDTPYYLPWNRLSESLRGYVQTNDKVMFLLPDRRPLQRSAHHPVADYYLHHLPIQYELVESPALVGVGAYEALARDYLDGARRVWIAYDPTQMPDHIGTLDQVLVTSHILCGTFVDSQQLHLNLYGQLPDMLDTLRFGDGITATLLSAPSVTDDRLNVLLAWKNAGSVPDSVYSVALHLEDADGNLVAQGDYGLPDADYSCQSRDLGVRDLPPGDYTLRLGAYNSATGERLPGFDSITGVTGDRLLLGMVKR